MYLKYLIGQWDPFPKNAIKTSHLLNRGALSPSNLTAHTVTPSRFFDAAGKQLSGITQVQLTLLCSSAALDQSFFTCVLWEWLQTGQGKTCVKWAHHRRVINKYSKVQLVLIGYRLMSRCDSPVQDGLLIIFRRGFSGLKQWRNTGLAHLLNLWKSWFLPGVQAWCLLKSEEICDPCRCFSHCVLLLLKLPWLSSRESRAYLGHVTSHGQRQLDGCRLSWPL